MSIMLHLGWFGLNATGGPVWTLSLGVVQFQATIPVLAKVLAREAASQRALGR